MTPSETPTGSIAGSVLPIRRAEELISTLQGVLSVRIVPNDYGSIDEIHVLTTNEVLPKQTVRNIESALIAQLGWRVNHRKISIATTLDPERAADRHSRASTDTQGASAWMETAPGTDARVQHLHGPTPHLTPEVARRIADQGLSAETVRGVTAKAGAAEIGVPVSGASESVAPLVGQMPSDTARPTGFSTASPQSAPERIATAGTADSSVLGPSQQGGAQERSSTRSPGTGVAGTTRSAEVTDSHLRRTILFEDVEVRRSRSAGVVCRVTLVRDGQEYIGEAEGHDSERSRIEVAARAAVTALLGSASSASGSRQLALEGAKLISAFDRQYVFVSLAARVGRESMVLTGSCEIRESSETSAVLAILDATNRWINLDR